MRHVFFEMDSTPPPSSEEDEEEEEGLFDGLSFYLDSDVNDRVRIRLVNNGGKIVSNLAPPFPKRFMRIINQDDDRYMDHSIPAEYQVVYQNWVNVCMLQKMLVDVSPFVACEPLVMTRLREKKKNEQGEEEPDAKRTKAPLYTKKEDEKLWKFANRYSKMKSLKPKNFSGTMPLKRTSFPNEVPYR